MTIKGYQLLGKAVKQQGVDTLFFLLGGPMTDSEGAVIKEGAQGIAVRHEQAAAMMAHAYARVRNRPGLCMGASGPGTINFGTGLATSLADCTPVVALGGSSSMLELGTGSFQEIDQVAIMRPMTKWAERVYEPRRIPELINKAFQTAASGKPGPVYLDFPGSILYEDIEESSIVWPDYSRGLQVGRSGGDPALVEQAIKLLAGAKRPVLIWGGGALFSEAAPALRAFVDKTGIPFFTTPQSRGVIPEDHEYCYLAARNAAFRDADVVLIVGTRVNYVLWHTKSPRFHEQAKFIRIDIDPTEIATTPRLDVGIIGDAKLAVEQFNAANDGRVHAGLFKDWRSKLSEDHLRRTKAQEATISTDQTPIHPLRLCKEVRDFIGRDTIMVVDGQDILAFGRQTIPSYLPGHRLNSGTFGTMGVGLPYAIGAKAARPDKQVVCLHGDGSFGFNAMELDTAARHKLGVITVISLNAGWTATNPKREKAGQFLGFTRYDKTAESLGCHGEFVEKPQDIRPALERANAAAKKGVPAVVNVKVDQHAGATMSRFTTYMT